MKTKNNRSPSLQQISTLGEAFDLLNKTCFDNMLPQVIINQQHRRSPGYFSPNRWKLKAGEDEILHEINLDPCSMSGDDRMLLANLLHEMVHLWQLLYGTPSRPGYHNRQFAEKMEAVGLRMLSLENPEKATGQRVVHEIIQGGPLDELMKNYSFHIKYYAVHLSSRKKNMIKYTCPQCGNNLWGKQGIESICKSCRIDYAEQKTQTGNIEIVS